MNVSTLALVIVALAVLRRLLRDLDLERADGAPGMQPGRREVLTDG